MIPGLRKIVSMSQPFFCNTQLIVHSHPEILEGTPVFIATRVPMKILLDYLEAGDWLNEFLDHFSSVSRARAISVLAMIRSPHNNV